MFDLKTQALLDKMKFRRCEGCKKFFLVRGIAGTSVPTLKKHKSICIRAKKG